MLRVRGESQLVLGRAFFTVEYINLLKGLALEFMTSCVCNERAQGPSIQILIEFTGPRE